LSEFSADEGHIFIKKEKECVGGFFNLLIKACLQQIKKQFLAQFAYNVVGFKNSKKYATKV